MFELDRVPLYKGQPGVGEGAEEHHVWVHWGVSREGAPGVQGSPQRRGGTRPPGAQAFWQMENPC